MKPRYLIIIALIILSGIAFFFLRPVPKPRSETPDGIAQEESSRALRANPAQSSESGKRNTANDGSLAGAYAMAAFIDDLLDTVPRDRIATRDHLRGLQVVFFISDYVMAAKVNSNLVLSPSAIVAAFTNVTQDTSLIRNRLRPWAVRPGTLTDHYRSISEIPSEVENIMAIKSALTENGVAIDTESDLLMDCIRYVVHNTDIHAIFGRNPGRTDDTPFAAALNSLVSTGDTVFQHRLTAKFGMDPQTATNVMNRLKGLRLRNLSPSDVEIPVVRFQDP